MTEYNHFAKELVKAFETMRTEHTKLYAEMKETEITLKNARTDNERLIRAAEANEAKQNYITGRNAAWMQYAEAVRDISKRFNETVVQNTSVKSSDVNTSVMQLLNSGLLETNDYIALLDEYSDNATMIKMIGGYADKYAENAHLEPQERQKLAQAQLYAEANEAPTAAFSQLVNDAEYCAGNKSSDRPDADYVYAMMNNFEKCCSRQVESL